MRARPERAGIYHLAAELTPSPGTLPFMSFDDVLRRMPRATARWTCPWFLTILALCSLSVIAGLLAGTTPGYVWGVCAAIFASYQAGQRNPDDEACQVQT